MRPRFLTTMIVLLMLCFSSAANADQLWGEFYADGIGLTEAEAAAAAQDSLDLVIDAWEDELEPGQEIFIIIGDNSWDFPVYTITYWVLVVDAPI